MYVQTSRLRTFKERRQAKGGDESTAGELTHEGVNDHDGNQVNGHIYKVRQYSKNWSKQIVYLNKCIQR